MMLCSIVGITGVQIVWIKNAIDVRNENFDHMAFAGIQDAVKSIEKSRKTTFLNSRFFSVDPLKAFESGVSGYSHQESYLSNGQGAMDVSITDKIVQHTGDDGVVISSRDTSFTIDHSPVIIPSTDNPGQMTIVPHEELQANHITGTYVRQKEFLEWIQRRANDFQNMSEQMISEIFQWEKTMNIDKREMNFALKKSLSFSGIDTPYEFVFIKNGSVEGETPNKTKNSDFLKSKYMVQLFPDNIIRQDLNLSVIFPERANYVLGSMAWILVASFLFSLIILATFALSLYFIVYQKKSSEMKSDFINNMTHEFKTPIATISLAADTITNPKIINDELKIRHFVSMIKKENSRMNKKVESILQIASLDKQEIEFKYEDVDIHKIIKKAVESIDILIQQRNGTITLNLSAINYQIHGDTEHLYNLINNLLDNAIKYSTEVLDILVETYSNKEGVVLSVEDKGMGMTKSVQSKIFERFYRQTSGNVHDIKGFGLGLHYVKSIVEAHRGTITVSSEPGVGSRFEVFLPFNQDVDPQ